MLMTTGWIPERRAFEGVVLAMAMARTTARVKRTPRLVRMETGNRREQWMEGESEGEREGAGEGNGGGEGEGKR